MGFFSQAAAMPLPPAQAEAIYDLSLDGERSRSIELDFDRAESEDAEDEGDGRSPWQRSNHDAPSGSSHLVVVSSAKSNP